MGEGQALSGSIWWDQWVHMVCKGGWQAGGFLFHSLGPGTIFTLPSPNPVLPLVKLAPNRPASPPTGTDLLGSSIGKC